ncbi:PIN domain-containing protein [Egbenema bharatensis]|uniref:PIN domain-containing protein n=1 Tax=Egbenema bharatensis TaxID=3463334 RepID=UPI003A8B6C7D
MVAVPPVILVFDVNALSAATPSEWREFSRVGNCYVPQVVYEEMKMLFDRSPDPDLESLAKAFNRFYATSGWKVTEAAGTHPVLKMGSGQALTRRARVSLAVGKCALGLSEEFPNSLVVLVTNDRSLLQRLFDIPNVNLCGITGDSLLQWSRTGQRPIAVSQKFQQFRAAYGLPPTASSKPSRSTSTGSPTGSPSGSSRPTTTYSPSKSTKSRSVRTSPDWLDWLPEARLFLLTLIGLAVAGYLLWTLFNLIDWQDIFRSPNSQSFRSEFFLSVDITRGIR